MRLTWNDLLIQGLDQEEVSSLLSPWSFLIQGSVAPVFLNRFGSWFLQRPHGQVDVLDVLSGVVAKAAGSYEAFVQQVNVVHWQEKYLLSRAVYDLHVAGKIPGKRECYAIVPHPVLSGGFPGRGAPLDPGRVMIMGLTVWQSICRQLLGGPA